MIAIAVAVAFLVGIGAAAALVRPRTTPEWLLVGGLGMPLGFGVTSMVLFACRILSPSLNALIFGADAALAVTAVLILRQQSWPKPRLSVPAVLSALSIATFLVAVAAVVMNSLHGDWDAWAIWNLRAKFLAAPGTASLAWSSALANTHPEYPLLLSASVARLWIYAAEHTPLAPQLLPVTFLAGGFAATAGAMAIARTSALACVAPLFLMLPGLHFHAAMQYSDVPLAILFVLAPLLLVAEQPHLAGAVAGLAAWTKDEGIVFALLFASATALARRDRVVSVWKGMAVPLTVALMFRIALAPSTANDWRFHPDRVDPVAGTLLTVLWDTGAGVFPALTAMLIVLGVQRKAWRDVLLPLLLAAGLALAYALVYICTAEDFRWRLSTSADRLAVHLVPLLGLAAFLLIRLPVSTLPKKRGV